MDADADLTERERAVVDAFQGEGSPVVERSFEPADGRTDALTGRVRRRDRPDAMTRRTDSS